MIESVVVDTDVVSFTFKLDSRAELYRSQLEGKLTIISFMTLAEARRWTVERNWGARRRKSLEAYLHDFIIIHSTDDLCAHWAAALHSAKRNGKPIQTSDAWIAATALLHSIPLVTHNGRHYAGVDGLRVISEPE